MRAGKQLEWRSGSWVRSSFLAGMRRKTTRTDHKKHRTGTKRNGAVEPVRLLQLSAAGEVFLEGTCPLSRCPQTAKFPAPYFWRTEKVGEKSDSFSRAERTRPLRPVSRLQYYDFANVPAECLQRYTMIFRSAEKGFSAADAKSEESQSGAGERAATFETCLSRRICRGGRFFIGAGRLAERNEKTV